MKAGCSLLLVDDNVIDVESVSRALARIEGEHRLHAANSEREALALLEQSVDRSGEDSLPDLILLDLSLPGASGLEVLMTLKSSENFSHIPVVIFSSSRSASDIKSAYRAGANGFVTKPPDFESLIQAMEGILHYWGKVAELPP